MTAPPNYTQIPNALLGNYAHGGIPEPGLMAEMTGAELKVYLCIARVTVGYHRQSRHVTIAEIEAFTGLGKTTIVKTCKALEAKNLITRQKDKNSFVFALNIVNKPVQKVNLTENNVNEKVQKVNSSKPYRKENCSESEPETLCKVQKVNQDGSESEPFQSDRKKRERKDKDDEEDINHVIALYAENIGDATGLIVDQLEDFCHDHGTGTVADAIKLAVNHNARKLSYIGAILQNGEAEAAEAEILDKPPPESAPQTNLQKAWEDIWPHLSHYGVFQGAEPVSLEGGVLGVKLRDSVSPEMVQDRFGLILTRVSEVVGVEIKLSEERILA